MSAPTGELRSQLHTDLRGATESLRFWMGQPDSLVVGAFSVEKQRRAARSWVEELERAAALLGDDAA
jgi:hypothetical protein